MSTRRAMVMRLQQAKETDDADEIEFQRPSYGSCKNDRNDETHSFLPLQHKLCMKDHRKFGKVILRTDTVFSKPSLLTEPFVKHSERPLATFSQKKLWGR